MQSLKLKWSIENHSYVSTVPDSFTGRLHLNNTFATTQIDWNTSIIIPAGGSGRTSNSQSVRRHFPTVPEFEAATWRGFAWLWRQRKWRQERGDEVVVTQTDVPGQGDGTVCVYLCKECELVWERLEKLATKLGFGENRNWCRRVLNTAQPQPERVSTFHAPFWVWKSQQQQQKNEYQYSLCHFEGLRLTEDCAIHSHKQYHSFRHLGSESHITRTGHQHFLFHFGSESHNSQNRYQRSACHFGCDRYYKRYK